MHRPIPEGMVVKQLRVVKKASGWYGMLVMETANISIPDAMPVGNAIGIDLGLEKFLAVSTGKLVARPKFFVQLRSKLKWLQRQLQDKVKGSSNYRQAQHKIRRLHEHIHNTRIEFHFLVAHQLCEGVGMIFAEDLNLKATSRGMLPKRPMCQTHTGKKDLSEQVHHCDECGYVTDRDVAAAQVVEQRGLAAVGQTDKLAVEEGCLGTPAKQQSPGSDSRTTLTPPTVLCSALGGCH